MKFSLATLFFTLASAKQVQARAMRSATTRENESEGRVLTALELSLSLSLSMSVELEEAQMLSLESDLSLSLSMPADLESAQLLSSDLDLSPSSSLPAKLEGVQLLMAMVDESKYSKLISSMKTNKGGSKASKKSCAFANPAIDQVFNFDVAPFEVLVLHALAANYHFEQALEGWLSKSLKLGDVEDYGYELGLPHSAFFSRFTPDVSKKTVCEMQGALVGQMEKTCFYAERKKDYETIAVALMSGFAEAVGLANFDGC